ncbi:hypothetical protein JMUB7494_27630 [Staphylococcus aureus]
MIKSIVAILGRPNVGNSTIFIRIDAVREPIVEEKTAVTRDCNYSSGD